jgi:hypothetical protein
VVRRLRDGCQPLGASRLASAARSTGRALLLAEHLDDRDLLAFALRVHGNELRKAGRSTAAVAHDDDPAAMAGHPADDHG